MTATPSTVVVADANVLINLIHVDRLEPGPGYRSLASLDSEASAWEKNETLGRGAAEEEPELLRS